MAAVVSASVLACVRSHAEVVIPLVRHIVNTIDRAQLGETVDEYADQWVTLGVQKVETIRIVKVCALSLARKLRTSGI
jgi:hypothetical protein